MDILAHGLWTNAVYAAASKEKRSRRDTWMAIFFGVAPDLFSFGVVILTNIASRGGLWSYAEARFRGEYKSKVAALVAQRFHLNGGPPDPSVIPDYVSTLYNFTHSLIIFGLIFLVVWALKKSPYWLMGGWGLHILTDIWSHSDKFFPTPFLFPISNFRISGMSWADPAFMIVNYSALAAIYLWLYKFRFKLKKDPT